MIEHFSIKEVATYDESGIQVAGLKKINFIYGANGSGKTTVTKYFYNPEDTVFHKCNLGWLGGTPVKALVYNKDFRNRNFGKGNIDGVFTLGQATKEQIEEIEQKTKNREEIKEKGRKEKKSLETLNFKLQELENDFKEEVWVEIYKKYEPEFKEAFKGFMQKELFKQKLLDEYETNISGHLTHEKLKEKADTIFGKAPTLLSIIQNISFERVVEIEEDNIWKKKVVGKADVDIANLIQKLNLNDWVNEGRGYLQEEETCPFCQEKTITVEFKKKLESYFDETFLKDIELIKSCSEEYSLLTANLLNILQQIESAEKLNENTKLNIETFTAYIKTLLSQLVTNKGLSHNKVKEPSRSIEFIPVKEQLGNIKELISAANSDIEKHNTIVANYTTEKSDLIKLIWKYLIEESRLRIQNFLKHKAGHLKGIDALTKRIDNLRIDYKKLDQEVKNLTKNSTSIQPSIDEINRSLSFYGFQNFSIVPCKTEKNQYQIQRGDGTLAESTLSEGEVTFITFLYFLQLAKGGSTEDDISDERILVIDDPISSLDSNILFVVSALLKEIIKGIKKSEGNIKQLILLTHNVYFHKEASFIDGRTKECSETAFWILRKNYNVSSIESYGMKNPIQNSYELLWMELRNKDENSGLTIQNTMRRIIENYFKILGKYGDDDLIQKFTDYQEQEICRSMISWINDGSHSIPDDLFIERQSTTIDKYFDVFKKIFVHTNHLEHYSMMMGAPSLN
ncbi:AAA family ATPase [Pontibacter populi]|uniref:AAA family ATPase n=1 Tax=Pontibacter populi TaxID=890055 RepID=A0ABV1RXR7_9BACT